MSHFATGPDGAAIAYEAAGEGAPVLMIHGFGASRIITWRNTGWYDWLARAGRRAIALDCRGHGESAKPHGREVYDERLMIGDALAVMDAAGIERADIMGYSMGAYLTVALLREAPDRFSSAVLAGLGENYFSFWPARNEIIAQGLLAADPAAITDPLAREFRAFCERAGNDLVALAACMRRERLSYTAAQLGEVTNPVLVVCGENDPIAGRAESFAAHFPGGSAVTVPRREHHSTVGDMEFKRAAREFLARGG